MQQYKDQQRNWEDKLFKLFPSKSEDLKSYCLMHNLDLGSLVVIRNRQLHNYNKQLVQMISQNTLKIPCLICKIEQVHFLEKIMQCLTESKENNRRTHLTYQLRRLRCNNQVYVDMQTRLRVIPLPIPKIPSFTHFKKRVKSDACNQANDDEWEIPIPKKILNQ